MAAAHQCGAEPACVAPPLAMTITLSELARRIHGTLLVDDSQTVISRIAPLDIASTGDLSFLPDFRFRQRLASCRASAVIVDKASIPFCPAEPLIVENLRIGCALAGTWLAHASRFNDIAHRLPQDYEIVDSTAMVSPSATLGRATTIGAHTVVGPGCAIGDGVRIGSYCSFGPNVTIEAAATFGNRVFVGANTSIGSEPFLYVRDQQRWLKLPSFGSVEVDDDVSLGSNVVLDRGAISNTTLMSGVKIGSHVHVGHGVMIGRDTAIAAHSAIAGEARIGDACIIGGAVGIGEGVEIAPRIRITAMSMVTKSLRDAGASYSSGWPVKLSRRWWRQVAMIARRQT